MAGSPSLRPRSGDVGESDLDQPRVVHMVSPVSLRVLEIHRPFDMPPGLGTVACAECRVPWPCPTADAANVHPEDYCHRCGGRNLSWWCDSDLWNAVMRPDGQGSPWLWNEIICPQCFADLAEVKFGRASFTFTIDPATRGGEAFAKHLSIHKQQEADRA